ncbi:GGDEF domain-containing protein [Xanthobacter sp. KR7-65]|uniref:GGDEF domain-containing protein n=1 Tax=Xanthobacter sp. KR7-65 TaxID=3156612 RepID=UPI0032B452EC
MNVALAMLLALGFLALAVMHRGSRSPVWFAASFGIVALAPLAMLVQSYTGWSMVLAPVIYLPFAASLILMVPGLAGLYRQPIPWPMVVGLSAITFLSATVILDARENTFLRVFFYQLPFTLATGACAWVVLSHSSRRLRDLLLAGLYGLLCLQVPLKATLAVSLGTGPHQINYLDSAYAVVSQLTTGILMMATGLTLLVVAVLELVRESEVVAETDSLSGLLNRRGFEQRAARAAAQDEKRGTPTVLLLMDIDHFKGVNDTYGHAVGDRTIRAFADMLQRTVPQSALVGRLGGEEFAVLLERASLEMGRLQAEAIRLATLGQDEAGIPRLTVSAGVAELRRDASLQASIERADAALYEAKRTGRNKVCCAAAESPLHNVVSLRR